MFDTFLNFCVFPNCWIDRSQLYFNVEWLWKKNNFLETSLVSVILAFSHKKEQILKIYCLYVVSTLIWRLNGNYCNLKVYFKALMLGGIIVINFRKNVRLNSWFFLIDSTSFNMLTSLNTALKWFIALLAWF